MLRRVRRARCKIAAVFQLPVDDEIALVLAEERHAEAVTEMIVRNQPRLARWEPWAEQPATVDGTRAFIRTALEDFLRGRQISTIIAVDGGRQFVGRCGLRINPYAGTADVGYWLDSQYERRGIASRSANALVTTAIAELELWRIELRTSVDNARSRAVAERLGFSFEGTLPGGLRFVHRSDDVALYAITAEQWRARASAVSQPGLRR
jgi:ribosomal-protein-serine acetyltransferase